MTSTKRFRECLKVILRSEGGFVDHKSDHGGRTNFGITQKVYDEFNKTRNQPERDVKFIHESEVETIYFTSYWVPAGCDKMLEPLDLLVFDFAVNSGVAHAVKTLQACLGVESDGKVGRNTINMIATIDLNGGSIALHKRYLEARRAFFDSIVARKPDQIVFLKGWMNRITLLQKEIGCG